MDGSTSEGARRDGDLRSAPDLLGSRGASSHERRRENVLHQMWLPGHPQPLESSGLSRRDLAPLRPLLERLLGLVGGAVPAHGASARHASNERTLGRPMSHLPVRAGSLAQAPIFAREPERRSPGTRPDIGSPAERRSRLFLHFPLTRPTGLVQIPFSGTRGFPGPSPRILARAQGLARHRQG
jgi:hypothetical protein